MFDRFGLRVTMLVALAACRSENTVAVQIQVDSFSQAPNNQVDILWVIDDSNSMQEEQAALAAGFTAFADELEATGTDFHIGIITTSFEYDNVERGKLVGDPPYLTNADDYESEFVERATAVGTDGSDKEKGLEAAIYAASPFNAVPGGINEGFVRPEAQLLTVIVSDEEDCSDGGALEGQDANACYGQREELTPISELVTSYRDLKPAENLLSVGVIVGLPNPCAEVIHSERYLSFARTMGGLQGNICSSDWTGMLGSIGLNAAGIREEFQLSRAAQVDTLVVLVNDVEVVEDPTNGWTYDVPSWTLSFHGTGIPPRGATIVVEYTVDVSKVDPEIPATP
jgi:hypothetical protein